MKTFDLIIIGAGSAGAAAAVKADSFGANIALIEPGSIGGTPANVGSARSKNLMRLGEIVHLARQKNLKALTGRRELGLDFNEALSEAEIVGKELRRRRCEEPLERLRHLTRFVGAAVFTGPDSIEVDGHILRGKKFIIATGAKDFIPPVEGLEHTGYLTHANIMGLSEPPKSLMVVGGGPVGLELAQMFTHFGTKVRVIQRGPRILPRVEAEIAEAAQGYLEQEELVIHTNEVVAAVRTEADSLIVTVQAVGRSHDYRSDKILMAVGRLANTDGLGLEAAGVSVDKRGSVIVDDELVTSVPHIFAAGDVRGEPMLASVAVKDGETAAVNALASGHIEVDYSSVPSCTFTHPEIAQVGLTEEEAKARGHKVETRSLEFKAVPKAQIMRDSRGLIKMVVELGTRRILGCGIVADHAGELINEVALAVKFKLSVDDIKDTVHVYPTLSEAVPLLAAEFDQPSVEGITIEEEREAA